LGKGTAVRNHSDVDLLVVLNGFRNLEDLVENMEDVIESFTDHLLSNGDVSIQMHPGTPFTLQFGVFCPSKGFRIHVDLLPIVDIFSAGTLTYIFCFERK
jgi:tRNA nucleotidyltransferase (CCA-adding enzyme)